MSGIKRSVFVEKLLLFLFLLLFLSSSAILLKYRGETSDLQRLAGLVEKSRPASAVTPSLPSASPSEQEETDIFALLSAQNGDFWGWLNIENTEVSYPVMHTPAEPQKYLHLGFDEQYSFHGTPFLDGRCTKTGNFYLIYGHNMRDGSLFAPLLAYADRDFYTAHPDLSLLTADGLTVYAVLGAFYAEAYPTSAENVFRYYDYTDLSDPDQFSAFTAGVRAAARYDTGVTAEYGDTLLALSTCSYHRENGRFVVVAVKKG